MIKYNMINKTMPRSADLGNNGNYSTRFGWRLAILLLRGLADIGDIITIGQKWIRLSNKTPGISIAKGSDKVILTVGA